jgi:hypothetical protein
MNDKQILTYTQFANLYQHTPLFDTPSKPNPKPTHTIEARDEGWDCTIHKGFQSDGRGDTYNITEDDQGFITVQTLDKNNTTKRFHKNLIDLFDGFPFMIEDTIKLLEKVISIEGFDFDCDKFGYDVDTMTDRVIQDAEAYDMLAVLRDSDKKLGFGSVKYGDVGFLYDFEATKRRENHPHTAIYAVMDDDEAFFIHGFHWQNVKLQRVPKDIFSIVKPTDRKYSFNNMTYGEGEPIYCQETNTIGIDLNGDWYELIQIGVH